MRGGVLITGGSGYLGRVLARRLIEAGYGRVCIYSRGEYAQARMRTEFNNDERLRFFIGDVRDRDRLERAMSSVQAVVHAAALKRIEVGAYDPEEMVKTNVDGTLNVIYAARTAGVERVLLVSSDKAFEPVSPYGLTKALAEALVLRADALEYGAARFAVVRYGNVAGSTGSVIPTWRAARTPIVHITDPDCTRFWMHVREAADLVAGTLDAMKGGELVVPELPAYRLADLAEAMGLTYRTVGLRDYEKKHESMAPGRSSEHARRMTLEELREKLTEVE